jgi:hypothetical protein
MDYPAEIKRWRAFADQAEQMARRWEQSPLPPDPAADPPRPGVSAAVALPIPSPEHCAQSMRIG